MLVATGTRKISQFVFATSLCGGWEFPSWKREGAKGYIIPLGPIQRGGETVLVAVDVVAIGE